MMGIKIYSKGKILWKHKIFKANILAIRNLLQLNIEILKFLTFIRFLTHE